MFKSSKKKSGICVFCEWLTIILTALSTITSIAAIAGLYKSHVMSDGLVFGTSTGSLSIIALIISLVFLKKTCEACMCECKIPKK
jgi:hypothetical protein